jgi:hypothetical protein
MALGNSTCYDNRVTGDSDDYVKEDNERLTQVKAGTPVGTCCAVTGIRSRRIGLRRAIRPSWSRFSAKSGVVQRHHGKLGLIDAYCPHRRAQLVYGMAEEMASVCVSRLEV